MLTSKERAELRSKANTLETTLTIGKDGVTDAVIAEAVRQLEARELVKAKLLESAMADPRDACDAICEATGADGVQVIGTKFVFYKKSDKPNKTGDGKPAGAKKKRNPVRAGVQKRRMQARQKKQKLQEMYHEAAVQTAIERRKQQAE